MRLLVPFQSNQDLPKIIGPLSIHSEHLPLILGPVLIHFHIYLRLWFRSSFTQHAYFGCWFSFKSLPHLPWTLGPVSTPSPSAVLPEYLSPSPGISHTGGLAVKQMRHRYTIL